jgi:hypothetical protein
MLTKYDIIRMQILKPRGNYFFPNLNGSSFLSKITGFFVEAIPGSRLKKKKF